MKQDLGVDVYRDCLVAYTAKNGVFKAHISDKQNTHIATIQCTNILALQKEVAIQIRKLREKK